MRTAISTLAIMASSLLVKQAFAAPAGRRDYFLDTHNVIVSEEVCVTKLPDGSYVTGAPNAVGTATIDGSAVLVTEPAPLPTIPPSAPAFQAPSPPPADIPSAPAPTPSPPSPPIDIPSVPTLAPTPPAAGIPATPTPSPTPSTSSTPLPGPTTSSVGADAVFIEKSRSSSAAPTTSAAPVPTKAPSPPSSGKRGLAYNDATLLTAFAGSSDVTWAYNWASTTPSIPSIPSKFEYTPMLWGLLPGDISNWAEAVSTGLAAGSTHLLAFNEPDHTAQANLSPAAAAAGYLTYMQPYASKAKLVSPAVTNGGGEMGLTWLSSFLGACATCTIDKVAVHWYNGGDAAAFKEYMAKAYTAGGKRPLWVTEFEASGSSGEQAAFLAEVMAWMDKTDYIERYAYFMVKEGNLISGKALSSLGSTYAAS